jgi:hypothetical protein
MPTKKSVLFIFTALLAVSALDGCPASPGASGSSGVSGSSSSSSSSVSTAQFWAQNFLSGSYYSFTATLLYSGSNCLVYSENGDIESGAVTAGEATSVGMDFDTNIFPMDTGVFGTPLDIDGTGKIFILIFTFIENTSGGAFVAGYFDANQSVTGPESSHHNVVNLNCDPDLQIYGIAIPGSELFDQTIAHEFQHLINFNVRILSNGYGEEDTFINEGLSVSAEGLYEARYYGSFLALQTMDGRISFYNDTNENAYIAAGENFVFWSEDFENYVTDFLFFQWLRIQSGGTATKNTGTKIYSDIINNPAYDYTAVLQSVQNDFTAQGMATASWQNVLCDWFSANWINASNGLLGYGGLISTTPGTLNSLTNISNQQWFLYPGYGIYVAGAVSNFSITDSGYIAYAGLSNNSLNETNGTVYYGTALLCYNYDGNSGDGYNQTGLLPDISHTAISGIMADKGFFTAKSYKGPYPVDLYFSSKKSIYSQLEDFKSRKEEVRALIGRLLYGTAGVR